VKRDLIASVMAVAVGLRGRKGRGWREGEEGKPALLPSDRVPTVVDALVLKLIGRRFRKAVHFRGHRRKRDTRGRQEEVREPGSVGGRGRGGTGTPRHQYVHRLAQKGREPTVSIKVVPISTCS